MMHRVFRSFFKSSLYVTDFGFGINPCVLPNCISLYIYTHTIGKHTGLYAKAKVSNIQARFNGETNKLYTCMFLCVCVMKFNCSRLFQKVKNHKKKVQAELNFKLNFNIIKNFKMPKIRLRGKCWFLIQQVPFIFHIDK